MRDVYVSTSGNVSATQATAALTAAPPVTAAATTSTDASGADAATAAAADAAQAVRNQAASALTSTGKGGGSTASAVSTRVETMVPLSAIAGFEYKPTPLSVNHQGGFVATTFSFSLPEGVTEDDATKAINAAMANIAVPISIHGAAAGSLQLAQNSLGTLPMLFLAAVATIYIVLGILYESYIHPLTILSTLPSAGVGAVLALLIFKTDFA